VQAETSGGQSEPCTKRIGRKSAAQHIARSSLPETGGEYGADNVGTEVPTGIGTSIDVVVRRPNGYWFYEIKTFQSPRACIREAIGQLLEYSLWPGSREAGRLIVVGETAADKKAMGYCSSLKKRFSLPVEYHQLALKSV